MKVTSTSPRRPLPILELRSASCAYDPSRPAIRDISFSAREGEILFGFNRPAVARPPSYEPSPGLNQFGPDKIFYRAGWFPLPQEQFQRRTAVSAWPFRNTPSSTPARRREHRLRASSSVAGGTDMSGSRNAAADRPRRARTDATRMSCREDSSSEWRFPSSAGAESCLASPR